MKNPKDPKAHETIPRPTMWRVSQEIGITQAALHKWFTGKGYPRLGNLQILANYLKCTPDEALHAINRAQAVCKAQGGLPYGVMIEKDMLIEEYNAIGNEKPSDGNTTQSEETI